MELGGVKILLISRPLAEIKDLLNGLLCIEHDRERKECLASLCFNNMRYNKISREHRGSFKWIWKPGSGKSTLIKYFGDHLAEREPAAKLAIVVKSHYNMLRLIVYERRLYLIINVVDESEKNDRRDVLKLLFELCSKTKYCIAKVFVVSRLVNELDLYEIKRDISSFARSFLDGLNLTHVFAQATEYVVENAQGVFLWLEDFYTLMFKKMNWDKQYPTDAIKIFRFVLFGRHSLMVDELLYALVIPDTQFTPLYDLFQRRIPSERRIIYYGGNRTVQVMHQMVREFFLDPEGHVANSKFRMSAKDAHVCISMTCIRYLMFCAANTSLAEILLDIKSWTSEHFEVYAQYLDKRPLANYALCYLKHHIDGGQQDENV
ncbi:hypothetical protein K469DRAFT_808477 [Zopfia rhizophila CBS 207.26]|uniref:NACHT domain-containing protein n=1 Tax=Zopfia rhizophila CBS 207.26 TaxID=1314779 RepID=A0A6A6EKP4_9PEZI|nr:hypothetical protein K469DRAFT_808477 [Zopfia rhizophila CBS 207.26]